MIPEPVLQSWKHYNSEGIRRLLPHRYPFLFVDQAWVHPEGYEAYGKKGVTQNEPFFPGNFPNETVFPGVLLVEIIAQVAAISVLAHHEGAQGQEIYLLSIEKARFRDKVIPGTLLLCHTTLDRQKGSFLWFRGELYVHSKQVAQAVIATRANFPADTRGK